MPTIHDLIFPLYLGEVRSAVPSRHPRPLPGTGVHCFGLVLDPAEVLIAAIFGARRSKLERFLADLSCFSFSLETSPSQVCCFSAALPDLRAYPFNDRELGSLVLLLHKSALASSPIEDLGGLPRLFCWGQKDSGAPIYDLAFTRLQKILPLPLDPVWYAGIWQALVKGGHAVACTVSGGFAPLWEIVITGEEWQSLILDMVKKGKLT